MLELVKSLEKSWWRIFQGPGGEITGLEEGAEVGADVGLEEGAEVGVEVGLFVGAASYAQNKRMILLEYDAKCNVKPAILTPNAAFPTTTLSN